MNPFPIKVKNLIKNYGAIEAVRGVSFEVAPGEIFGLIGPDGAGKTSIIRILVTLLKGDSGEVLFQGRNIVREATFVRSHIGYMPQRFSLYPDLTVDENMNFFGDLFAIPKKEQDLRKQKMYEFSRLGPFKERRAGKLSGGMKQKLALSCMLMHAPKVIVLDEPTFGVDPVSRQEFWEILKALASEGTSILVTTAYMDEAKLCDRVGLIFEGKILATDTPQALLEKFDRPLYKISHQNPHQLHDMLSKTDLAKDCDLFGDGLHVTDRQQLGYEKLGARLAELVSEPLNLEVIKPDMEDLFLSLMKEN